MNNIFDDIQEENLKLKQELNKILDILPITMKLIDSVNPLVLNNIDDVANFLQTIIDLELGE